MNLNEYLDDILIDVNNKKINNVISKLDFKITTKLTEENKKKILDISNYLINNDLTVYDDEPLLNIIKVLDDINDSDSFFYAGSIYYDMALKNHSVDYFKIAIEYLKKSEQTEEIYKILSDSYFYIFILSKEEDTLISDLNEAKKYLELSNIKEDVEFFKIEYNYCGYYLKNSNYKKAISHGLKALKYKNDEECIELLPELYCFLGLSYIKLDNYKKSISSYKKAIDLIYQSKDIDLSLLKEALFNLAENYNAIKNFNLELKTRINLKHILDENDEEDLELLYINSKELAYIEKYNNQLTYAIKDAKTSLKMARKLNVSLDRLYESILLVAYVYYDLENYELYTKYVKDSIATAKLINDLELKFKFVSNSLNELAIYYFLSDQEESLAYFLELKDLYNNNLDYLNRKNISDYVDVYLSIAKLLSNKNEINDAIYLLEEIKAFIIKKIKNDKSYYYEMSLIYNRLGIIYSDMNEMQKTIDYFILAINSFKKTESKENIDVLEPFYTNLASAYSDTEEYELAIDTLNKKIELLDDIYNGRDIEDYVDAKVDILFEIINEYKNLDDNANIKKITEEIISILEADEITKTYNLKEKLAQAYDSYGTILNMDTFDDYLAISYYEKAKELFKQLKKVNPQYGINEIYTNNSIAYCYQVIPDYEKSEKYYLESLFLINKLKKRYALYDELSNGIALRGLAYLYDQEEDVTKSEEYYEKAIKSFEELFKNDNNYYDSLKSLYNNIIKFYDHIMNHDNVKKYKVKLTKLEAKMSKK